MFTKKYLQPKVCLPGLHISLGVFFRLFTLLEDECHGLDVQMAMHNSQQSGDRQAFVDYATAIQRERTLLDEKEKCEGEVKWLNQTLGYLALHSTNSSNDPTMISVATAIKDTKKKLVDIVSTQEGCVS